MITAEQIEKAFTDPVSYRTASWLIASATCERAPNIAEIKARLLEMAATPAPETNSAVSNGMIEAACQSHYRWYMSETTTEEQRDIARSQVRTILNAAFSYQAPPQNRSEGAE